MRLVRHLSFIIFGIGCLSWPALAEASALECGELMPVIGSPHSPKRLIEASDLVTLRDIGPTGSGFPTARIFGISPDGTHIAFQIRRGDPIRNRYCIGIMVVSTKGGSRPKLVDIGGEFIQGGSSQQAWPGKHVGYAAPIEPKWSADGNWIAFLRRDGGRTQIWRARSDGSGSDVISHFDFDVEEFAWGKDDRSLVVMGRPSWGQQEKAIADEAPRGFLFDERYVPTLSKAPLPPGPFPPAYFVLDLVSGRTSAASPLEAALLGPVPSAAFSAAIASKITGSETVGSFERRPGLLAAGTTLKVEMASGGVIECRSEECDSVIDFWWSKTRGAVVYTRREGEDRSGTGIYLWNPQGGRSRRLSLSDDVLQGCQLSADTLICGDEGAIHPRRIVAISLDTGKASIVFDPNPEFQELKLGSVRRLRWTNAFGIKTFGDLVLPPQGAGERKLPLIIVGYDSRGFLRGGTGDDYPIQLFAAAGFAVLSFQRPVDWGYVHGGKVENLDFERLNKLGWADRKSVQSSLEQGIDLAVATAHIDRDKIGITGFSDGVSTAQYALINSRIFKAAAFSHCCEDRQSVMTSLGPASADFLHEIGYPTLAQSGDDFWSPYSLSLNADKIKTPILMQIPDDELGLSLETYTTLKQTGAPVEMYIFQDEYHIKWQPAHRLAVYNRSLDWFNYWLRGLTDNTPAKAEQYRRWGSLSETAAKAVKP